MQGKLIVLAALCAAAAGCDASDNTIDPGDLQLRDLLGFDPGVAAGWDSSQRASAREVFDRGLAEPAPPVEVRLGLGIELDERVGEALYEIDGDLAITGEDALGLVRVKIDDQILGADPVVVALDEPAPAPAIDVALSPAWNAVPGGAAMVARGTALLGAMATHAGFDGGKLEIAPSPRLAVVAAYVDQPGHPHLLVNPVLLGALEPAAEEDQAAAVALANPTPPAPPVARPMIRSGTPVDPDLAPVAQGANPYSFYGSIAECAVAEQLRCEACLPSDCPSETVGGDGNTECTTFAMDAGRGYSLFCANMAVSISGVIECVKDAAPGCAIDEQAVRDLASLEANANFVDDTTCAAALDGCLADLYGASDGTYTGPDPDPPRDTAVSCGDSSPNCQFDPSCQVSGPSCGNSLSCDGACANSSSQGGCGATCGSCGSNDGTSTSGGSCGSCGSTSGGGGSSDGCGSCGSSSSGGSSDACGSCGSSSSGGSSDACGSCGSSSSSDSSCGGDSCSGGGGDCGGGSSSNSCNIARQTREPTGLTVLFQMMWALVPIPAAAWVRRRSKKKKPETDEKDDDGEVSP